jgi:dipeptidyl aminopeptidase/acylaminoacyl peptidase
MVGVGSDRRNLNTGQSAVTQLTHGDFDHTDPAWTPDGKQLLFVSARHATRDVDNCSDIWVMDVGDLTDTSSTTERPERKVTSTTGPLAMPVPSPDGTHVMYFGHAHPVDTGRQTRAWVQPIGAEQKVPDNASGPIDRNVVASSQMRPAWLAGTERVVFAAEDDGATVITSAPSGVNESPMQRSAGNRQDIVSGSRDVSGFHVAGDGTRIVFVASDATTPPELFVTELGDDGTWRERQLTNLNAHWCRRTKRVEPVRHMITRDGHDVVYWVMLPASDEGETQTLIPALVNIHGGPHAQYGDRFFDEFLVYAGAGYAVIYANPRGSMGSTEAFSRAVTGDWGGGDAADILAVVDDALSRYPLIDPTRLGIMGGSYGGYLTSSIVTQTDRFVAACSERALNSFASFAGTSDIGFWFSNGELGTSPFDDADTAARHSPLTYASRITTPMLIIHSEQDLRCPIEQAEQLHVALLLAGKVSRFVRFANADHELSRTGRPRQRLERFRHILDWFEPYLRPKGR